jgi:hypothetical protein
MALRVPENGEVQALLPTSFHALRSPPVELPKVESRYAPAPVSATGW